MNEFNVPLDNNARVNLVTASAPEVVFSNNNINGINAIKELNDTLKTANDGISKMYAQYKDMINSIIWEKYAFRVDKDYDDMYQIGSEALLNAIRTYDETKGKLSTNCYTAIVNRLKHMDIYIDNISISPCSKAIEIKNYIIKNKDMSYDEMFRNCDIACSRSDFNNIATMLNQDSLDDVFPLTSETKGNSVVDNNANVEKDIEDEESKNELVSNIKKNISRYSDNTQKIYMTWLKSKEDDIDITYKVIGDMYGVSKQRVDQVIKMVNKKLQEKLNY